MSEVSTSGADESARPMEEVFDIVQRDVPLPRGVVTLDLPRNSDVLITEADYVRDERLPYWADLWPSAVALAQVVDEMPRVARPAKALELGCGLGLVTIAAMRAGYGATATDYYGDALRFTRRNADRVVGREPETQLVDWRAFPSDLGRFDLVLASDVLYERPYATLIAEAIARSLTADGFALVADPGRVAVEAFLAACDLLGLEVRERARIPWQDDKVQQTITIHEVRARRGA